jgi:putative transposase
MRVRHGQSAKSGLNKSWLDAAFGQFFKTLDYIAAKAGAVVLEQKPAYTSMVLSYRNEIIFTDCSIRDYWDEQNSLMVARDVNAAINLKRPTRAAHPLWIKETLSLPLPFSPSSF